MEILISGASTGIGKACAVHLARLGHGVWAGVRAQKNFDEFEKMNVKGLQPVFLDVTDSKSIRDCVSLVTKKAGTIHGLVNNAGIAVGGPIEAVSMKDWRGLFDTNYFGLIELTQACLPRLRESKGRIVNMSSISGRIAFPFMGPYASSKFAVEAVSDCLRRELKRHGVKVAIVEPGAISTPIWEKSLNVGMGKAAKYPAEINDIYGHALQKFAKRVEETVRMAAPVSVVVKAVEHALTSKRPKTRYPVGRGIKLIAAGSNFLPDLIMDRAIL
jgi:NAD(P)-dependent dehydrogenase (short-subunit alcohol dehydrogenase family)